MPSWTRFLLIISQISSFFFPCSNFWKRLLTACLHSLFICENNRTLHLAVRSLLKPWPATFSPSLSLLPRFRFFLCPPPLVFLSFFLFFSWSPSLRPRTQHFPTECGAEGWAFVSCSTGTHGGRRRHGWLPGCQLGVYVSVRKSRGDISDDDRRAAHPRDWLQLKKYIEFAIFLRQLHLNNFISGCQLFWSLLSY